jgi:hypothetical protein
MLMKRRPLDLILGLAAAAALAACAGHGTVPGQQSFQQSTPSLSAPAASSPCDIAGHWYFRGGCSAFDLKARGMQVNLSAVAGVTVSLQMKKNNAPANTQFIVGDGTDLKNITGTSGGKKFPIFGKVPCYNWYGKIDCKGAALVYVEVINASSIDVKFTGDPNFTITASSFPGKVCRLFDVGRTPKGTYVYSEYPTTGTPEGGKLEIATGGRPTITAHNGTIFAIPCE